MAVNYSRVWRSTIWQNGTPTFLARMRIESGLNDVLAIRADVSAITYTVSDQFGVVHGTPNVSLVVDEVMYDFIQMGTIWKFDSTGFNFRAKLPATLFDEKSFVVVFRFVLAAPDHDVTFLEFVVPAQATPMI